MTYEKNTKKKAGVNLCVLWERLLFFSMVNNPFSKTKVEMEIKKMCTYGRQV